MSTFFASTFAFGRPPEIPRTADENRITDYLLLLPEHGSQSFFKDVERLAQAHDEGRTYERLGHGDDPERTPEVEWCRVEADRGRTAVDARVQYDLRGRRATGRCEFSVSR